jgi:hypothetical protein
MHMGLQQIESFLLLAMISIAYFLAIHRIDRLRLAVVDRELPSLGNTAWIIAGSVVLSPMLIILLVALIFAEEWWSVVRHVGQRAYKHAYAGAAAAAAGVAAWSALRILPGPVGAVLAVVIFLATNVMLMAAVIIASRQFARLRMFANLRGHLLECGTAVAGLALAAAMDVTPILALVSVPALVLLHQADLRAVLRDPPYDPDSQLWSECAWREKAALMLASARVGRVLLMIIDPVDPITARLIRGSLGPSVHEADPVGRYGSGQVAVLLKLGPCDPGIYVRGILSGLAAAGVTVPVGYAVSGPGADLNGLLLCAGQDLMESRVVAAMDAALGG